MSSQEATFRCLIRVNLLKRIGSGFAQFDRCLRSFVFHQMNYAPTTCVSEQPFFTSVDYALLVEMPKHQYGSVCF